ncbi:hypothetical protein [Dehalococcoides mccartyi]|uniref:hypothetical protein n=1 Tax=Dehalococcoides mccartyi TaxID=61435 RepID=UPI000870D904|nr:hypothetical protein [Dehalococcoides mccartyi]AOV98874.1 hypothetical protein DCWBC2_0201 [Dehalococcoides mccartyi]
MAERGFQTELWTDPFIQGLSPEAKLLFIYLWTNKHCNQAGLYEISLKTMAFDETPQNLHLLPQTRTRGKYSLKMDRMGNILITHNMHPGKDVFLQFESDKEIIFELLHRAERKDLEAGWPVEIADNQPRASILDELWECQNKAQETTKIAGQNRDSGTVGEERKQSYHRTPDGKSPYSSRNNTNSGRSSEGNLDFLSDSQEFLAYTIEDIGYRDKIDDAFIEAIKRARGKNTW